MSIRVIDPNEMLAEVNAGLQGTDEHLPSSEEVLRWQRLVSSGMNDLAAQIRGWIDEAAMEVKFTKRNVPLSNSRIQKPNKLSAPVVQAFTIAGPKGKLDFVPSSSWISYANFLVDISAPSGMYRLYNQDEKTNGKQQWVIGSRNPDKPLLLFDEDKFRQLLNGKRL